MTCKVCLYTICLKYTSQYTIRIIYLSRDNVIFDLHNTRVFYNFFGLNCCRVLYIGGYFSQRSTVCPNLQELILEQCNITDATINAIINLRHNLQKLNIIYCDQVSRNAISSIKSFNLEIRLRSTKLLVIRD